MRIFFIILLSFSSLFSFNLKKELRLIKGEALVLEFKGKDYKLFLDNKPLLSFENPAKKGFFIAIIAMPYKDKKELFLKVIKNKKSYFSKIIPEEGNYKKEQIRVAKSKVSPPKSQLQRISKEYLEALKIYKSYTKKALFKTSFIKPIDSATTSAFGTARLFNKSLKSFHSGQDFKASKGTPVLASNDGLVRLVDKRYFAGGSVIIDHGYGIYTQYYHLSSFSVKPGDIVKKGQIIALSGATGRVSGPHLHFGVRVNNIQVNPIAFLKKINAVLKK